MQRPTCTGVRLRSTADAHVVFHAVSVGILPMVTRRLDSEERRSILPGSVFVWEERSPNTEATGLGIERWTDGIKWGPSRVRDDFLLYNEKDVDFDLELSCDMDRAFRSQSPSGRTWGNPADRLVKQTYSVFIDTNKGRRKWHLIAYFTQDSVDYLHTIDDFPQLATLRVPEGVYKKARLSKGRGRDEYAYDRQLFAMSERSSYSYSPYTCSSSLPPISPRFDVEPDLARPRLQPPVWHDHPHTPELGSRPRCLVSGSHDNGPASLAPLAYLESIPQACRHPLDEKALRSFQSRSS